MVFCKSLFEFLTFFIEPILTIYFMGKHAIFKLEEIRWLRELVLLWLIDL